MSGLPDAEAQTPACGACCGDTESYDTDGYTCDDCQLFFDAETLKASFVDPDAKPCGVPCGNYWHGDNKIRPGVGYDCGTCKLPEGHSSMHWTGCEPKLLNAGAA